MASVLGHGRLSPDFNMSLDECTTGHHPAPRTDRHWRWPFFPGDWRWFLSTGQDADGSTADFGVVKSVVMMKVGAHKFVEIAERAHQARKLEEGQVPSEWRSRNRRSEPALVWGGMVRAIAVGLSSLYSGSAPSAFVDW